MIFCLFEFEVLRPFAHLGFERFDDVAAFTEKELFELRHVFGMRVEGFLFQQARGWTNADVKVHTWRGAPGFVGYADVRGFVGRPSGIRRHSPLRTGSPGRFSDLRRDVCEIHPARPNFEKTAHVFEAGRNARPRRIRSEVSSFFSANARPLDRGDGTVGNADVRQIFVILHENVVFRPDFFDEIRFEHQRFDSRAGFDDLDIGNFFDHLLFHRPERRFAVEI